MKKKKPLYVAKRSAFSAFSLKTVIPMILTFIPLCALIDVTLTDLMNGYGFIHEFYRVEYIDGLAYPFINWLAIIGALIAITPYVIQAALVLRVRTYRLKIYDTKIVRKLGLIFRTQEEQRLFVGINEVTVDEPFWDRLLGKGTVRVLCPSNLDFIETDIRDPYSLKRFLEEQFVDRQNIVLHGALRSSTRA